MSGNVWEWVNDWYSRDYYSVSPAANPTGPDEGQLLRDGKSYRVLRGGSWYNGQWGHGRVSNRNPSYYRGPDDPDHRWYHIGFRVVKAADEQAADASKKTGVIEQGADLITLADGFTFTEGPAVNVDGRIYFSDVRENKIYTWSVSTGLEVFVEKSHGANGLYFDSNGNLLVCQGNAGRLVSINPQGEIILVSEKYNGIPFNQPNDLWINQKGGIYFSDPVFGGGNLAQDGECVYYISPDRKTTLRVIDDMVRPNGLIGTPDGKILYVADHGAKKTWRYSINEDGSLSEKTIFVPLGSDGMTLDNQGNVYITNASVLVYSPSGEKINEIVTPARPTNVTFGGVENRSLIITATDSLCSIRMNVSGAYGNSSRATRNISVSGRRDPKNERW